VPKYRVEYGIDVAAYGSAYLEADNLDALISQAKQLHENNNLITDWDIFPDSGTTNPCVVHVYEDKPDVGWALIGVDFPLEDDDEEAKLWLVYSDDLNTIYGHATQREDAEAIAEQLRDVRILEVNL